MGTLEESILLKVMEGESAIAVEKIRSMNNGEIARLLRYANSLITLLENEQDRRDSNEEAVESEET